MNSFALALVLLNLRNPTLNTLLCTSRSISVYYYLHTRVHCALHNVSADFHGKYSALGGGLPSFFCVSLSHFVFGTYRPYNKSCNNKLCSLPMLSLRQWKCSGWVNSGKTRSRQSAGQNSDLIKEILLPFEWEPWRRNDGKEVCLFAWAFTYCLEADFSLSGFVTVLDYYSAWLEVRECN